VVRRIRLAVVVMVGLVAAQAAPAHAQYFGRQKVRFETPDFRVLATEHFDVYYYPAERAGATEAARLAERWYARLSTFFDHELRGRQPLVLYASPAAFRQTNVVDGDLGEGTGGVTESLRRRIVLPLAGSLAATDHVLGHELVHAFQYDISDDARRGSGRGVSAAGQLPLWFVEGMAEYLSLGPVDAQTAMWLRDAVRHEALPTVRRLDDSRYFPYRWGHALWAYVAGRWGDGVVATALREAARSGAAERALTTTVGLSEAELSRDWHAAIRESVAPRLKTAQAPGDLGTLTFPPRRAGEVNVGPALSPDGRLVAYLSERELLSVDLFVAETATGRQVAKVASTVRDAHLSSLLYIASAGAWDADGRRLAYATRRGGRAAIDVYDVAARRSLEPLLPAGVDEIQTPAWSPDGSRLAFIGMRGGVQDLFVVELATGTLRPLTDDPFSELHPVWAPDGRQLVVATDRFTTALASGVAGHYQLARVAVDTGRVERLVADTWPGQMLNPQWADPAGQQLLFIGDAGGIANLWRLDPATGGVTRVTDVASGVAGITPVSPALSVAPAASRAVVSVFDESGTRLVTLDLGRLAPLPPIPAAAAALPPTARRDAEVAAYLGDPSGLPPADAAFTDAPYRWRFGLDAVIQPSVGIGVDRFGSYAGGQVAFLFGDMLGDHALVTAFQASTTLDSSFSYQDLGGLVSYLDRSRRWTWTATVEQTPYRTGYVTAGLGLVGGQAAIVEQEVVLRQTIQAASGVAAYPLDDARRVEVGGGLQRYTFSERVRTIATGLADGRQLVDERREIGDIDDLSLGRTMAAFVGDRSVFGPTSPVAGSRYRVEVAPTFGSLRYTGMLADYRRYVMPVPFVTLAGRLLHYGRYGAGGDDPRLSPLFLGYPELVRGYDVGSFRAEECGAAGCEVFDRLVGSRLLVANAELRMPLLRPLGTGRRMYGPVPTELAVFADAGVAWDRTTKPAFAGGSRDWATSAGVAARVNAFGIAIVQLSAARPFQRPGRGWLFQFSLTPGF